MQKFSSLSLSLSHFLIIYACARFFRFVFAPTTAPSYSYLPLSLYVYGYMHIETPHLLYR